MPPAVSILLESCIFKVVEKALELMCQNMFKVYYEDTRMTSVGV